MNTLCKWSGMAGWAMLVVMMLASCKEPEPPKPDDKTPTELTAAQADALLGTLHFENGVNVTGSIPSTPDIDLLQMRGDTLYAVSGIGIPVQIKHPEGVAISGFFVGVNNSTYYYDVPVYDTFDGDTVSVIIFQIEPDNEEPPYEIPVEIIAYNEIKTKIDRITRVIKVEKPAEPGCTITKELTSDSTWDYIWWSTVTYNYNHEVSFFNVPGRPFVTETNYQGCCDPTQPDGKCNPLSTTLNASVYFEVLYIIMEEEFSFYSNGTFWRRTHELKKNFDPTTTQWCAGWAGFATTHDIVYYNGTHDFTPGAEKITFGASVSSCDLCGYGSPGGDLVYTCNLIAITRNIPGSSTTRIYIREDSEVDSWYY